MDKHTQKFLNVILIVIFWGIIYAPLVKMIFYPISDISETEKRKLAPFPKFKIDKERIKSFPSEFESYYNDHFGFRNRLIYGYNYIKAMWLGKSPVPDVMIGKEGWLYYTRFKMIEKYQGTVVHKTETLEAWKQILEHRQNWLAKQGIRYLFVIAPNKVSVYPEYLPDYVNRLRDETITDQLVEYLHHHSDIHFLDLRTPLREAKKKGILYLQTDTHWNQKGSFIAYLNIMRYILNWFPNEKFFMDESLLDTEIKDSKGGDLAVMLGLSDILRENRPFLTLSSPCSQKQEQNLDFPEFEHTEKYKMPFAMGCSKANLRTVVFRDSFFSAVIPFFSESFKKVVYIYTTYDYNIIKKLIKDMQPDIVVEEIVERSILLPVEDFDPELHYKLGNLYKKYNNLNYAKKHYEKAITLYLKYNETSSDQSLLIQSLNNLALVHAVKGEYERAISLFNVIMKSQADNTDAPYYMAAIYSRKNNIEKSIYWLKEAVKKGFKDWQLLKTDNNFKNIRNTPYYQSLIKKD